MVLSESEYDACDEEFSDMGSERSTSPRPTSQQQHKLGETKPSLSVKDDGMDLCALFFSLSSICSLCYYFIFVCHIFSWVCSLCSSSNVLKYCIPQQGMGLLKFQ
jgi:hypothetical protein